MDLKIFAPIDKLNGQIKPPGSKSYSHRAFILAGMAQGVSIIKDPLISGDIEVTIDILRELGVKILPQLNKSSYIITGKENFSTTITKYIDCQNSGTTIRIFSALALLIKGGLKLKGEFFKRARPIEPLLEALKSLGAKYSLNENSLSIERKNSQCESIEIAGDISSQFITALLILAPLIRCDSKDFIEIKLTTKLISYPYVKITLDILQKFGINIIEEESKNGFLKYIIETGQKLRTQDYEIPADFSSAAFIIAASVISTGDSTVIIKNLDFQNPQGDKKLIQILRKMGAKIQVNLAEKNIIIQGNINKNPLKGIDIDCKDIPDLFPILSVIGAFAQGKTRLYNAKNLRLKESDRISAMAEELRKMGIEVEQKEDGLIIHHAERISGATIDHRKDHRIAMACIIAALYASTESRINNIEIINDSYPQFLDDLQKLGAKLKIIS